MSQKFKLVSKFEPRGDQPRAIEKLTKNINSGKRDQVVLGATGTGKSVTADTPVLIYLADENGQLYPQIVAIGDIIDKSMSKADHVEFSQDATEILYAADLDKNYFVPSFDPSSKQVEIKPITAFVRHESPDYLYKVKTSCGREATFTGDHNFYVLRDGQLELIETQDIRITDYIPLPVDLENLAPQQDLDFIQLQNYLDCKAYIEFAKMLNSCVEIYSKAKVLTSMKTVCGESYATKYHSVVNKSERINLKHFTGLAEEMDFLQTMDVDVKSRLGEQTLFNNYPLSNDFLELLGVYIAEGWAKDGYVLLSVRETEFFDYVTGLIEVLGFKYLVRPNGDIVINNVLLADLLRNLAGCGSANKKLPDFWPRLSLRQLALVLKGYFSGDGGVDGSMVAATTKSKKLSSDLLYALNRFGIWARSAREFKRATNSDHKGDFYHQISISGQDNLIKFKREIGFLIERKNKSLDLILDKKANTNVDLIPGVGRLVKQIRQKYHLHQRDIAEMAGVVRSMVGLVESGQRLFSRQACEVLYANLSLQYQNCELVDELRSLLNLRWTGVASLEKLNATDKYVYDFSVKDNETFLAGHGGMFVHNTFVMAQVVQAVQKPTLVLAHNKTLAAQLCSEFQEFFPNNAVSYFVSYYDYYQPEAYLPHTDTYIEKDASINEEIDKYRHAATINLLTRKDVLIVASVSCIYGLGSVESYENLAIEIKVGEEKKRDKLLRHLTDLQYTRSAMEFRHGMFHVLGDTVEIFPRDRDTIFRLEFFGDEVERITEADAFTGEEIAEMDSIKIFPAKHDVTSAEKIEHSIAGIRQELEERYAYLQSIGKNLEAERLRTRTEYDLEILKETGYCSGIENYTRYLNLREPGEQSATLLDYFPDDFLMFIDESHITVPQIGGMHNGNYSRKQTLIEHGFRLPSAHDNRPLKFEEFEKHINQAVYVSATPGKYELEKCPKDIVELVIRPTGLVDPEVVVHPSKGQIESILKNISESVQRNERVLITTLTKRSAEDLTEFLTDAGIKVKYLHSDIDTMERIEILRDLRLGKFDVLVGINLLREGLDLPEVSFIAIMDADKQGFLRSTSALIQTIGRAARNVNGHVIMYADRMTDAMKGALGETERRRAKQVAYNEEHGITPETIIKAVKDISMGKKEGGDRKKKKFDPNKIPKDEIKRIIEMLEAQMDLASQNMEFEKAADLRDEIEMLREEHGV